MTATLLDLLQRIEAGGERAFLAGRRAELSAAAFAAQAARVAGGLAALGLRRGDRVAAALEHDADLALLPFACAWLGAIAVPINPRLKDAQIRHVVDDADAALVWTSAARLVGIEDRDAAFGRRPIALRDDPPPPGCVALPAVSAPAPRPLAPADPAILLYTSGSTGRPKGIVQSQRSLCDGARIVADYLALREDDHLLAVLPLSFDYGLNQVLSAAYAGARVSLLQYLHAGEVVRALRARGCSGLAGVPELWVDVVAALRRDGAALPSLRFVTNSGGALPERVIRYFADEHPQVEVFAMYGLSEAFRSSFVPPDELRAGRRGIGRAMPEVELFVVDPDGAVLPPEQVGELVHCGACVAEGYWRQPAATARRFRPHPLRGAAGGICVFSGDLARRAADGFLTLVGRADEQLKIGGYRIAPDEVEAVVRQVDGVRSAAAVAVPRGEDGLPALCVAIEAERPDADAALLTQAVLRVCKRALPAWMVPAELRLVDRLPRSANEKLDRVALRRMFTDV